jgi:hypothetical protein
LDPFLEVPHAQLKREILEREIDDSSMRENKWGILGPISI